MPTASAKVEKVASNEAADPIKQILVLMEKKVRNLEKRKGKLDNYRNDHKNGKELNEDQQNAMKKYDQVIEVLEFAKELQKTFNLMFQESARFHKKIQKKEFIERQHHEFQQIRQLLFFQDILAKLMLDEVRNDFLNGENGAVKLSEKELDNIDEFYKMVSLEENCEQNIQSYEAKFSSSAEHYVALIEAKNREISGTTYKQLKDILTKVQQCDYFTQRPNNSEISDSPAEEPEISEGESKVEKDSEEEVKEECIENGENTNEDVENNINGSVDLEIPLVPQSEEIPIKPTEEQETTNDCQLQDVLPVQGSFNFLQESQIDMESPHMDPAVVVAHPMAPPPNLTCRHSQYNSTKTSTSSSTVSVENETPPCVPTTIVVPLQPIAVSHSGDPSMTLSQAVLNHPSQDFDPNQPIPTQTFTNQNFVAMQNIMTVVSPYVPVTLPTQHFSPVTLMQPQSSDISTSVIVHSTEIPVPVCENQDLTEKETKENLGTKHNGNEESVQNEENTSTCLESNGIASQSETQTSNHYSPHIQNNRQPRSFNRGPRGGRGRSSNGYMRGRGGYGNSIGYYHQGSYGNRDNSGNSSGYINNYRGRGLRGGMRGGMRGNNNRGGRGGYRPQQ